MKKQLFKLLIFSLLCQFGVVQAASNPEIKFYTVEAKTLNASDLTGIYVLKTSTNRYLSHIATPAATTYAPLYALDITKNTDGIYYLAWGDNKANYIHDWNLSFSNTTTDKNTWIIKVVSGSKITVQRNDGSGKYIKFENDSTRSVVLANTCNVI